MMESKYLQRRYEPQRASGFADDVSPHDAYLQQGANLLLESDSRPDLHSPSLSYPSLVNLPPELVMNLQRHVLLGTESMQAEIMQHGQRAISEEYYVALARRFRPSIEEAAREFELQGDAFERFASCVNRTMREFWDRRMEEFLRLHHQRLLIEEASVSHSTAAAYERSRQTSASRRRSSPRRNSSTEMKNVSGTKPRQRSDERSKKRRATPPPRSHHSSSERRDQHLSGHSQSSDHASARRYTQSGLDTTVRRQHAPQRLPHAPANIKSVLYEDYRIDQPLFRALREQVNSYLAQVAERIVEGFVPSQGQLYAILTEFGDKLREFGADMGADEFKVMSEKVRFIARQLFEKGVRRIRLEGARGPLPLAFQGEGDRGESSKYSPAPRGNDDYWLDQDLFKALHAHVRGYLERYRSLLEVGHQLTRGQIIAMESGFTMTRQAYGQSLSEDQYRELCRKVKVVAKKLFDKGAQLIRSEGVPQLKHIFSNEGSKSHSHSSSQPSRSKRQHEHQSSIKSSDHQKKLSRKETLKLEAGDEFPEKLRLDIKKFLCKELELRRAEIKRGGVVTEDEFEKIEADAMKAVVVPYGSAHNLQMSETNDLHSKAKEVIAEIWNVGINDLRDEAEREKRKRKTDQSAATKRKASEDKSPVSKRKSSGDAKLSGQDSDLLKFFSAPEDAVLLEEMMNALKASSSAATNDRAHRGGVASSAEFAFDVEDLLNTFGHDNIGSLSL